MPARGHRLHGCHSTVEIAVLDADAEPVMRDALDYDVVDQDVEEALAEIHAKFRLAKAQCGTGPWLEENVRRLPTVPTHISGAAVASTESVAPASAAAGTAPAPATGEPAVSAARGALESLALASESKGELF